MKLPGVRTDNIVVQEIDNEILLYDLTRNKAFCLNQTSSIVYEACQRNASITELTSKGKFSEDVVLLALKQLKDDNLISDVSLPPSIANLSRREAIRKVGLTSMVALPVISSLIAPAAIHAASCLATGGACTTGVQCCSGICMFNFCV